MIIIDIFFNILNFLILLTIAGYFLYRYIPKIKNNIELEKKNKLALKEEHLSILKEQKRIEVIQEENIYFHTKMLQKIEKWKVASISRAAYIRQEQENRKLNTQEKLNNKAIYLALYQIRKQALSQAINLAKIDLKNYFNNNSIQKNYMQNIMQNIKSQTP